MPIEITTFQSDVTPPIGHPLCHGSCPPVRRIVEPLTARGIVILADAAPIVLCAVDWVCIASKSHDAWREAIAQAAGTSAARVAVHSLHPHDAPGSDLGAAEILTECGLRTAMLDPDFESAAIEATAEAVRESLTSPRPITHLAMGKAKVSEFASNRRILGSDGKIEHVRFSSCRSENIRAKPEGVIDPFVRMLAFWHNDEPVASLTYYATHPQSFYGQGAVNPDTVGIARALREATVPQAFHCHFNGAGGNIAAGKYNDGSPTNRLTLAGRLTRGMEEAWEHAEKIPLSANDVGWHTVPVSLPLNELLIDEDQWLPILADPDGPRIRAARNLSFARRIKSGQQIDVSCLRLGPAFVLYLPGELFVEYQLAAQEMLPDAMVCMAAYGDCGMSYIGTEVAYSQGGYETSADHSRVGPEVEEVLMSAVRRLLRT